MNPYTFLAEVTPFDPVSSATVTVRMSLAGKQTSFVAGSSHQWLPVLTKVPVINYSLQSESGYGGFDTGYTPINLRFPHDLFLEDGRPVSELKDLDWDGALCRIWMGDPSANFSSFTQIMEGRCGPLTMGDNRVSATVVFRGPAGDLDKDILTASYTGTGGQNGPSNLTGVLKPWCSGVVKNITPLLIDNINWVYQYHGYGETASIDGVFENAISLGAPTQTATTYAQLVGLTLAEGEWAAAPAVGMFRLGAEPTGQITADVTGARDGATTPTRVGAICAHLIKDRAGIAASKLTSAASLDAAWPHDTGYYVTQQAKVYGVVAELVQDINGYMIPDGSANWIFGRNVNSKAPANVDLLRQAEPLVRSEVELLDAPSRAWKVRVGGDRNWTPNSGVSDLLKEALEQLRTNVTGFLTNESHNVPATSTGTVTDWAGATGTFRVLNNALDVTTSATFSLVGTNGLTASINPTTGVYSATAMASESGTATFRASYNGLEIDKTFSVTKSRAGADGTQAVLVKLTASHQVFPYDTEGNAKAQTATFQATKQGTTANLTWRILRADGTTYLETTNKADVVATGFFGDGGTDALTQTQAQFNSFISGMSGGGTSYRIRVFPVGNAAIFDELTILKVQDGAEGPQGAQGIQGPQGPAGVNGQPGTSVAEFNVYRRSATQPASPTGGSFNFGTVTLTAPTNWSSSIPTGADPVWVSRGVAVTNTVGGTDTPDWSTPARAFEDGQAVDAIYRRSATQPATPSASSGTPSGWYSTIASVPAGSDPIWTSFGKRSSPQANWVWEAPVRIQGIDGAAGAPGPQGPQGPAIVVTKNRDFTYVNGTLTPTSQTVTFTASLQNVSGTINWTTLPNIKSGTGTTFSITPAEMGTAQVVIVTATVGTVSGSSSVSRLADPTARPSPVYRQPTPPTNVDGAWWLNNGIVGAEEIAFSDGSEWRVGGTVGARAGVNLRRNNAVLLNDGDVVTNLGTAAFIAGQGWAATQGEDLTSNLRLATNAQSSQTLFFNQNFDITAPGTSPLRPAGVRAVDSTNTLQDNLLGYADGVAGGALAIGVGSGLATRAFFPLWRVNRRARYRVRGRIKASAATSSGLYIRFLELDSEAPATAITMTTPTVQTDPTVVTATREITSPSNGTLTGSSAIENLGLTTSYQNFDIEAAPSSANVKYMGLQILRWSGASPAQVHVESVVIEEILPESVLGYDYTGALNATFGATAGTNLYRSNGSTVMTQAEVRTAEGTAAFIAGQGALAVQNNVNYATQVVGTYRPETFVFGCRGNSASPPTGYTEGLIDTAGTNLGGFVRSYRVYYRTFGSSTWVTQGFDVFGTAGQNTAMANYLNAIPTGAVVVVLSFDEPQNNRLSGGLPAAMYRCGASRSVFGRNNFAVRSAYALIGRAGIGEGMGTEYYKGDEDSDTNAWISGTFTIVNGVPVIGYSPIRGAVDLVYPDGTRLDQLQPGEPSADVTSLITGATALTVEFDSTGTAKTGQLPRTSTYKLIRNGVEITSGVTWSVTVIEGSGTASVSGSGSGLLSVNSLPSSSRFRLQAVYAGTTRNFEVQVTRVVDAPPPASGGGTSQTDTSLLGWQNSWAVVSDTLTVNAGSAGSVNLTANFEFTSQAQQSTIETYVKFQKWNGSSWVDIGSVVASNPDCLRDYDAEFREWLTLQFGTINYSFTDTAPSPNQTGLRYRLLAYSSALINGQLSTAIGANVTASGV